MKLSYNLLQATCLFLAVVICPHLSGAQAFSWTKNGSGAQGLSVATDKSHNTIAAGIYYIPAQFGSTTMANRGMYDGFLAKYDNSGILLWAKDFGGAGDDYANATATDASGNIYVCGYFTSSVIHFTSADSLMLSGVQSFFLAKYSSTGTFIWARKGDVSGTNNMAAATALTVSADGSIFMGGYYTGNLTFGSTTITGGQNNLFLMKFNSSGTALWGVGGHTAFICKLNALTTDVSGNIYATGKVSAAIDWGAGLQPLPQGGDRMMTAKFNPTGVLQWMQYEGKANGTTTAPHNFDCGNGIGVDGSGNVYIGGALLDTSFYNSSTQTLTTYQWAALLKYNSAGVKQWSQKMGRNENNVITSLTMDANGNPYVIGNYKDTMSIAGTSLPAATSTRTFVAKLSPAGSVAWYNTASSTGNIYGSGIAVDVNGAVAITGSFYLNGAFGPTSFTNATGNAFVSRLNTAGAGISAGGTISGVAIYPNPATSVLHLKTQHTGRYLVTLSDGRGRIVLMQPMETDCTLNIGSLPAGAYFLLLTNEAGERFSSRVTKL